MITENNSALSGLLPPNSTVIERQLIDAAAVDKTITDPEKIQLLSDAYQVPESFLPWLAWQNNVPVWDKELEDYTKRTLIAKSRELHRTVGTDSSVKNLTRILGGRVKSIIRPGVQYFVGKQLTLQERNAFLDKMPEFRFYRFRERSIARGQLFTKCKILYAKKFPRSSSAYTRFGEKVYFHQQGNSVPVHSYELATETQQKNAVNRRQVVLNGKGIKGSFAGYPIKYCHNHKAKQRIYTLDEAIAYEEKSETLRKITLSPGLEPVSHKYNLVAQRGIKQNIFIAGHYAGRNLAKSDAYLRLYRVVKLHDPHVPLMSRGANCFAGYGRLGMPHHQLEVKVDLRSKRPRRMNRAGGFSGFFPLQKNQKKLQRVLQGLAFCRRATDKLLVDTKTHRIVMAKDNIKAGFELKAGQMIEV